MTAFTGRRPPGPARAPARPGLLPVWILAIVGMTYASAVAVRTSYDDPGRDRAYAGTVGDSPASIAMAGPPGRADRHDGGILIYETSLTALARASA